MFGMCYSFPAMRGIQAGEEYFVCMVPLGVLDVLFGQGAECVPPEFRAQRRINKSRVPAISRYILDNRNSYVFSSLTASIDGEFDFLPLDSSGIGTLKVSMEARFLLNDGQHRRAAISVALQEDPTLKDETISMVLFGDKGLRRSQQMFSDLNRNAVTTSKSLNALYDTRDICSALGKAIVEGVPFLKKYTDKEKDNLGKYSHMLFTLNNFVNSVKKMSKKVDRDITGEEAKKYLVSFWKCVASHMNEWGMMERKELSKKDLREMYIVTQGVVILALGSLADYCFEKKIELEKILPGLENIDWSRSNEKDWIGCAIKKNGRINRTQRGILLTYLKIKSLLGLGLTPGEKRELKRGA